jgi:limonene-1,2-epoxide hydrolase
VFPRSPHLDRDAHGADTARAMSQENVEIVRNMLDAFNRDDLEAVIASYEEGCEIVEPPRCQAPGG